MGKKRNKIQKGQTERKKESREKGNQIFSKIIKEVGRQQKIKANKISKPAGAPHRSARARDGDAGDEPPLVVEVVHYTFEPYAHTRNKTGKQYNACNTRQCMVNSEIAGNWQCPDTSS